MTRDTDYAFERGEADQKAGVRVEDWPTFETAEELAAYAEGYALAEMLGGGA